MLRPVSSGCVYGGVAKVSVYVHGQAQGIGIGSGLLHLLVALSEKAGICKLRFSLKTARTRVPESDKWGAERN